MMDWLGEIMVDVIDWYFDHPWTVITVCAGVMVLALIHAV